ncbi:MAG: hypothetical protein IKC31_05235 [Clostridia bacterium]|nr:hypothetical protein [Clostridia bacterium]
MQFKHTNEDAYFVASNSARGFYSDYHACFDHARIGRVFAVKGGPGTGKNRFLREVAQKGEKVGYHCEYIYCSSDPDSLDGIILSKGKDCLALMDATAPHVYEPSLVGVRESLIDLGAFWDAELLRSRKEEILRCSQEKKEAYARAYRYLAGVGEMMRVKEAMAAPYIKRDGISRLAALLARELPCGTGFSSSPALIHSIGMKGEVVLDSYLRSAKQIFLIEDCKESGPLLLAALVEQAKKKELSLRLAYHPVCPDRLEAIFVQDCSVAFVIGKEKDWGSDQRPIRMRRFVDVHAMRAIRERYCHAERARKELLKGALLELSSVRNAHFALEEIYMQAMDFPKKEQFTKDFIDALFVLQNGKNCDII